MTPYLRLSHLLSLAWLAYPIISLLFVAFRLLLSLDTAEGDIASVKSDLLASCQAAEHAATSAASMPRYMAIATNEQFADAVNGVIAGAQDVLVLSLTVMETIINFIVDIYRSTFLCFLELVVRGGLELLIAATQALNTLVNSAASSLRTSIQNDISNANSVISTAVNAVNKVNPFSKITAPSITVPSLDGLQNLTLPSSFQDALVQLNNSIPNIDNLKQTIDDILDQPFELVKADINDTFANITFDSSILPVPSQNTVTFCDQLDLSVVDDLGAELVKVAKIGVAILVVMALILTGLHCLWIKYRWGRMMAHLQYTRQAWITDPTVYHTKSTSSTPEVVLSDHNLLVLQADMHHPLITRIINNLSARFHLTTAQHINMRWFFHYIFHPPALACFLIGFFGLLSVELQLLALGPLSAQFSDRVAATTNDFSTTIATALNASMFNQSSAYANDINSRVDVIQSTINDGLFGWVNDTTTTINNTVNAFYTDIQNAVTILFNGTFFEAPAQDFIQCFIGSKVNDIEIALTFLHNNLQVNMPRVNESVLVLSQNSVDEITQPIARAAVGSGNSGSDTGFVGKLIATYEASLKKERTMFAVFMGIWGIVVLMAICILLWNNYGSHWFEERRRRKWQREQRSGIDGLIVPLKDRSSDEKRPVDIPDGQTTPLPPPPFTPLPTPRETPFRPFASFTANASPGASPAGSINRGFEPTHPRFRSDETLVMTSNADDGDDLFTAEKSNTESRSVKALDKLRAIGRKVVNREHRGDDIHQTEVENSGNADDVENGRRVAWLRRVASKLTKNADSSEEPTSAQEKEAVTSSPYSTSGLKSRWSNDTTTPTGTGPLRIGSANRRAAPLPPMPHTAALPLRPARPPISPGLSAEVRMNDQEPRSSGSTKPTVAPVPLHHGFVNAAPRPPQPSVFDWSTRSGLTAFPPPPSRNNGRKRPSPNLSTAALSSGFSNSPGATDSAVLPITKPLQLSSALPKPPRHNQRDQERGTSRESSTSVTRLLATTHPHKSSGTTNPFISPFDDEHRVRIHMDNPARASVATNPFSSPAGIAF